MKKFTIPALVLVFIAVAAAWLLLRAPHPTSYHFNFTLKGNQVTSGSAELKVNRGDDVKITVTAINYGEDTALIHGYDQRAELDDADGPSTVHFIADKTGVFPIVVESSQKRIGSLTVR